MVVIRRTMVVPERTASGKYPTPKSTHGARIRAMTHGGATLPAGAAKASPRGGRIIPRNESHQSRTRHWHRPRDWEEWSMPSPQEWQMHFSQRDWLSPPVLHPGEAVDGGTVDDGGWRMAEVDGSGFGVWNFWDLRVARKVRKDPRWKDIKGPVKNAVC